MVTKEEAEDAVVEEEKQVVEEEKQAVVEKQAVGEEAEQEEAEQRAARLQVRRERLCALQPLLQPGGELLLVVLPPPLLLQLTRLAPAVLLELLRLRAHLGGVHRQHAALGERVAQRAAEREARVHRAARGMQTATTWISVVCMRCGR